MLLNHQIIIMSPAALQLEDCPVSHRYGIKSICGGAGFQVRDFVLEELEEIDFSEN
jgi:hypothetical protein